MRNKYTLGESAAVFGIAGLMIPLIALITVPLGLLVAWMRSTVWNWFMVPYFHLPHIGVWLMFAIGIFIGMFSTPMPQLKDDLIKYTGWKQAILILVGQIIAFSIAWAIHIWILTGN